MTRKPIVPAAILVLAAASGWFRGGAAHAEPPIQSGPMPVLTDTTEYCNQLEKQILARPNRPPEVVRLTGEGHQMCDHGEVRQGVTRLRRALRMLKTRPGYQLAPHQ